MAMGSISSIFIWLTLLLLSVTAWAEEKSEPLIGAEDMNQLKDTILSLPKLGKTGIILFLVAVVVAIGVWWWWKGYAKKITKRENDERRTKDQASNKTENQDVSDEWNEAHDRVEDIREGLDTGQPKKPRPDKPEGD